MLSLLVKFVCLMFEYTKYTLRATTRLAQLVERKTFNLVVEGSSPSSGVLFPFFTFSFGERTVIVKRLA